MGNIEKNNINNKSIINLKENLKDCFLNLDLDNELTEGVCGILDKNLLNKTV